MQELVRLENVGKTYGKGGVAVQALSEASFSIYKGEFCVILGPSGAGKTTLLNLLGGMDQASQGSIFVDGQDITALNERELTRYRREKVGFVFQFYNLVPNLTALENVELAAQICPHPLPAAQALRDVGLGERMGHFPAQLSGGEQQRVSIARALAKNPQLLLCDEPTGALDVSTGKAVLALLEQRCRQLGQTVVLITHNSAIAPMADRIIHARNGRIMENSLNRNRISIQDIDW